MSRIVGDENWLKKGQKTWIKVADKAVEKAELEMMHNSKLRTVMKEAGDTGMK